MAAQAVGDRVGSIVRDRFKVFLADYRLEGPVGESSQAEEYLVRVGMGWARAGSSQALCPSTAPFTPHTLPTPTYPPHHCRCTCARLKRCASCP